MSERLFVLSWFYSLAVTSFSTFIFIFLVLTRLWSKIICRYTTKAPRGREAGQRACRLLSTKKRRYLFVFPCEFVRVHFLIPTLNLPCLLYCISQCTQRLLRLSGLFAVRLVTSSHFHEISIEKKKLHKIIHCKLFCHHRENF